MALERLFDPAAKAQYLLFSRASDNHNPDLVVIQRRTFLKNVARGNVRFLWTKNNSCCHFPSTQLQWWACFIYFLITFHRIPDESTSHLLAPVKQFSIGKQRSLHHCTIPTWTEEPETTRHRKQPFSQTNTLSVLFHSGWMPVWFLLRKTCVRTMGGSGSV